MFPLCEKMKCVVLILGVLCYFSLGGGEDSSPPCAFRRCLRAALDRVKAGLANICMPFSKVTRFSAQWQIYPRCFMVLAQLAIDLRGNSIRKEPFQAIWTYERPGDQVGSAVSLNSLKNNLCIYGKKILLFE